MKDTLHNIFFFELHDKASPVRYEKFAVPASARSAEMAFPTNEIFISPLRLFLRTNLELLLRKSFNLTKSEAGKNFKIQYAHEAHMNTKTHHVCRHVQMSSNTHSYI